MAMGYRALKWDPFEAADLEMDRAQRRRDHRDRRGGARRGRPRHRADARRPRPPQRAHRHRHVPRARALRPHLDRGADPAREHRRPGRGPRREPGRRSPPASAGTSPAASLEALRRRAVDILQPDVSHAGGLGETKRVAHLAHDHLIPVAPHNPVGPVMNAMTLHPPWRSPTSRVFETVSIDVPWRKELVRETLRFEDGAILAPDRARASASS